MTPDEKEALLKAILGIPPPWYAVLDGGAFDDLPALLIEWKLENRSLYLEGGDPETRAAAGFLVTLSDPGTIRRTIELIEAKPSVVVWSWPDGVASLYRHLRTLNIVEIPQDRGVPVGASAGFETVLFRHWDATVLNALLPALTAEQFSRFVGAAPTLLLYSADMGGIKMDVPVGRLPPAPRGMLRLQPDQIDRLAANRRGMSDRRIEDYLREVAPDETAAMGPDGVRALLAASQSRGRELGLRTELSFGLWSWVWLRTQGTVGTSREIENVLTRASGNPDEALKALFDGMIGRGWRD